MSVAATYSVQVFAQNGNKIHAEVFQGDQAYSEAFSYLETVKQREQAAEIWLTRMDGPEPVFVGKPLVRSPDGTWHEEQSKEDRTGP